MADSPDSMKAWRPEQPKSLKIRRIKPSKRHRQEIQYHVEPYEIFLPSKKADQLSEMQLLEYKEAFTYYDKNGDGTISLDELRTIMVSFGQDPSVQELEEMMKEIDTDGSGAIDFSEFLHIMASTTKDRDEDEEQLREAFQMFDTNNKGYISAKELETIMAKLGVNLTKEEISGMIREADFDGDGFINYEDFAQIMGQK